jgi:protoporphyrinogen oxidase
MTAANHVIVGGGIAGLTAALLLSQKKSNKVLLVEQSHRLGGLLHTDHHPSGHRFDAGMHFWTETGHPGLDSILFGLLPDHEWLRLKGNRRDCSGLFFRGQIQFNTQYPDLRGLPEPEYQRCLADFFFNLGQTEPDPAPAGSFADHARHRFGPHIAQTYLKPIAEKIHGCSAKQLHPMARFFPLLDRIALFDEPLFADLMASAALRARIAYPEQRNLPLNHSSGLSSAYPRRYGIRQVIEAFRERLQQNDVSIFLGSRISSLKVEGKRISAVTVSHDGTQCLTVEAPLSLTWTGSQFPLARLLGLDNIAPPLPSRRTVLISMIVNHVPPLRDLYCLFCADSGFNTYRVTNYPAYCPDAVNYGGYPITLEMIVDGADCHDRDALARQALDEARRMGLLPPDDTPSFVHVEVLASGFPDISNQSVAAMTASREAIDGLELGNLLRGGILAEENLFFQKDILLDIYRKVEAWR